MKRFVILSALLSAGLVAGHTAAQAQDSARPRLLFLTHAGLYKHSSLERAERTVTELGRQGGFDVTTVEGYRYEADDIDLSFISAEYLSQYDGLMMITNGNLPLTQVQKGALIEFVRRGGAFIGTHNAALTLYNYAEFGEMLGGYFRRTVSQDRAFVLRVEDRTHPATSMLGETWTLQDEFYQFGMEAWDYRRPEANADVLFGHQIPVGFSRDRVNVLLSIDTEASDLEGLTDVPAERDYPQAWYRTYGEGRSFYTALGHTDEIWTDNPTFRAHLLGGIRWALRLED